MNRIILISHNRLAEGMKRAVEMIAGPQANLECLGLMPGEQPDALIDIFKQTIQPEQNIIILADIVGGSMCNAAMALLPLPNVRIIGGMNLALVLEVVLATPQTEAEIQHVIESASQNMHEVQLVANQEQEEDFF